MSRYNAYGASNLSWLQSLLRALAQCLGTNYPEASNLSRCSIVIAGRCACPGLAAITDLSSVQEQKQKGDKQITIVRVR